MREEKRSARFPAPTTGRAPRAPAQALVSFQTGSLMRECGCRHRFCLPRNPRVLRVRYVSRGATKQVTMTGIARDLAEVEAAVSTLASGQRGTLVLVQTGSTAVEPVGD